VSLCLPSGIDGKAMNAGRLVRRFAISRVARNRALARGWRGAY